MENIFKQEKILENDFLGKKKYWENILRQKQIQKKYLLKRKYSKIIFFDTKKFLKIILDKIFKKNYKNYLFNIE